MKKNEPLKFQTSSLIERIGRVLTLFIIFIDAFSNQPIFEQYPQKFFIVLLTKHNSSHRLIALQ